MTSDITPIPDEPPLRRGGALRGAGPRRSSDFLKAAGFVDVPPIPSEAPLRRGGSLRGAGPRRSSDFLHAAGFVDVPQANGTGTMRPGALRGAARRGDATSTASPTPCSCGSTRSSPGLCSSPRSRSPRSTTMTRSASTPSGPT